MKRTKIEESPRKYDNQRRNGFIYQEHEDLIIVLNIHRTKGSPLSLLPSSTISKAKPRRMKMGMGGALNGIENSILTNNDNLSICGLSLMKRTSQYALVLLVNHSANDCPTQKGFCITQYHMVQQISMVFKLSQHRSIITMSHT